MLPCSMVAESVGTAMPSGSTTTPTAAMQSSRYCRGDNRCACQIQATSNGHVCARSAPPRPAACAAAAYGSHTCSYWNAACCKSTRDQSASAAALHSARSLRTAAIIPLASLLLFVFVFVELIHSGRNLIATALTLKALKSDLPIAVPALAAAPGALACAWPECGCSADGLPCGGAVLRDRGLVWRAADEPASSCLRGRGRGKSFFQVSFIDVALLGAAIIPRLYFWSPSLVSLTPYAAGRFNAPTNCVCGRGFFLCSGPVCSAFVVVLAAFAKG